MFKTTAFFIIMLFVLIYVRVGILLKFELLISLRVNMCSHESSLIPPLTFYRSGCDNPGNVCVRGINFTIYLFDFGTIPAVWYFFFVLFLNQDFQETTTYTGMLHGHKHILMATRQFLNEFNSNLISVLN